MNLRQQSMTQYVLAFNSYLSPTEWDKVAKAISTLSKSNDHDVESHKALEEAIDLIEVKKKACEHLYYGRR